MYSFLYKKYLYSVKAMIYSKYNRKIICTFHIGALK